MAALGLAAPGGAAGTGAVHPGVQTVTGGSQCTANFVYSDGTATYIGQAAHCSGTGGNTATNGCSSGSLPINTPVQVDGASKPGTMVYNSWLTMQSLHESDPYVCQYNDLALIKLDPADVPNVSPTVPVWGGPNGVSPGGLLPGDSVYSYGNSSLRLGITLLSPKEGVSLLEDGNGWSHEVMTVTPGIPGDSGSAYLDNQGRALGILSTVSLAPIPLSNGVGDLGHELVYLHAHGFPNVNLVKGLVAFNGSALPIG